MAYELSTFKGNEQHSIQCTGDVVAGDEVAFERATFTGSFRNAKFAGFERIAGKIITDSYGQKSQQHTFTIQTAGGEIIKIKGRNLYKNGVWRKPWDDERARVAVADEKHSRGAQARMQKELNYANV